MATCPQCLGPLDERTAGVTGRGLVCQRCVLRELDADRAQQEASEVGRADGRPRSATGLLISGAVFASRELARKQVWLDDRTLVIPAFGRGLEMWHFGDDALLKATIDKENCTPVNERRLASPSLWPTIASAHTEQPWSGLTKIVVRQERPWMFFGTREMTVEADDRKRADALVMRRAEGWTKTERTLGALESLSLPGCFLVLAAVVLVPLYALSAWLGSWDWDALLADLDEHGGRRRGQARILLWLGWLVGAAGPWLSGGAFAVVCVVVLLSAVGRLRKRPIETTYAPPDPGTPVRP